jgi:hypothetical protein
VPILASKNDGPDWLTLASLAGNVLLGVKTENQTKANAQLRADATALRDTIASLQSRYETAMRAKAAEIAARDRRIAGLERQLAATKQPAKV